MWAPGLTKFLMDAGDKPYRALVQHHLRKQSVERLRQAMLGELESLPQQFKPQVEEFIDRANEKLAYDKTFWKSATVQEAFNTIMELSTKIFSNNPIKESGALSPENHELAMGLFQILTMNFAYSAAGDKNMRKSTGIRKGLFN